MVIYKIATRAQWDAATQAGVFAGAPVDLKDGYIHFSTAEQVGETLAKHFSGQLDLLLISVDTEPLGDALRWEVSRGGALFPHLYATLPVRAAIAVRAIPLASDGTHTIAGLVDG